MPMPAEQEGMVQQCCASRANRPEVIDVLRPGSKPLTMQPQLLLTDQLAAVQSSVDRLQECCNSLDSRQELTNKIVTEIREYIFMQLTQPGIGNLMPLAGRPSNVPATAMGYLNASPQTTASTGSGGTMAATWNGVQRQVAAGAPTAASAVGSVVASAVKMPPAVAGTTARPEDDDAEADNEASEAANGAESKIQLIFFDTIPAAVIVLNAFVMGISADYDPEGPIWSVLEVVFTIFFVSEMLLKMRVMGCHQFWMGKGWYWNHFDFLCVTTAIVDLLITHVFAGADADMSSMMLMKLLRLARLARLVRLLRFRIFRELGELVRGLIDGMRVLFWSIVLLFVTIFFFGIVARKMIMNVAEFSTLQASMFTIFRCLTEGCSAYDGTPLTEGLRESYGNTFIFIYSLAILFVQFGLFNLIMAVFIDHVVNRHAEVKQRLLGENMERHEKALRREFADMILNRNKKDNRSEFKKDFAKFQNRFKGGGGAAAGGGGGGAGEVALNGNVADLANVRINREEFVEMLQDKTVIALLEEMQIDVSMREEIFDALDADLGGSLEMDEFIGGLMKLRGPVTKNDIIAVRMKVRYLTQCVDQMSNLIGCNGNGNASKLPRPDIDSDGKARR